MSIFDLALNPYVGCGFGCSYCYAAFFVADETRRATWGTWVDVKTSALEEIELCRDLAGKRLFMSTATDPYQPLEAKVGLTRLPVEAMAHPLRQPRLVVQTRSPLVLRDIDLFKRFKNIRVNMSITTDCDEIRKLFEPKCASIERRMEAVRKLKSEGIRTGVTIAPMLPLRDPVAFGKRLADLEADVYAVLDFHESTRPFSAGTREDAKSLLRSLGWTSDDFRGAKAVLYRYLPRGNGFDAE